MKRSELRVFALLMDARFRSWKNSFSGREALKRAPFLVAGAGFWVAFYLGTKAVLHYVRGIEFFGEIIAEQIFSLTFLSLTGFLVLSTVIAALSAFYLSADIPFLLSKPIELRDVIRLKTVESIMNSSWMVLSFIPPVFIAYGTAYHAPAAYYGALFSALALFILLASAVGIAAAHILTRIFPARRTRETLLALGVVLFLLVYYIVKKLVPADLSSPEDILFSFIRIKADSPLLPHYWIARWVLPLLRGGKTDLLYAAVLLVNTAFSLLVSSLVGRLLYRGNISRLQPAGQKSGRGPAGGCYPGGGLAVLYKDSKMFFRDTGQWSQIFMVGALMLVYYYNFSSIPVDALATASPFMRELMVLANMVLAGLVLSAVAARFLYTAVSFEGRAFWVIRTAPVALRGYLWSKFIYGSLPLAASIGLLVFLTDAAINARGALMVVSVATAVLLSFSIGGLGVGFGAVYPKFRHENIASVSMSLTGMAFMLIAFLSVLATLAAESWVFFLFRAKTAQGIALSLMEKGEIMVCLCFIAALNAALVFIPMRIGTKKLAEDHLI